MPPQPAGTDFDPKTMLNEHGKDISGLSAKVDKCYSELNYQKFQEDVKKITIETIGGEDGRTKIKAHAKESAKEYYQENRWSKLQFWIPTIISVATLIALIYEALNK